MARAAGTCGSRSTTRTDNPCPVATAAMLMVVEVLPVPPFCEINEITTMLTNSHACLEVGFLASGESCYKMCMKAGKADCSPPVM